MAFIDKEKYIPTDKVALKEKAGLEHARRTILEAITAEPGDCEQMEYLVFSGRELVLQYLNDSYKFSKEKANSLVLDLLGQARETHKAYWSAQTGIRQCHCPSNIKKWF